MTSTCVLTAYLCLYKYRHDKPFLEQLAHDAYILDLGCGSGRDTLAFRKKGYYVDAIDYSEELVKKATELTGLKVRYQSFYD